MSQPTAQGQNAATPVHQLGATAVVANNVLANLDNAIVALAQDASGNGTYDNDRAMVGFLESKYNLVISTAMLAQVNNAASIDVDLKELGKKGGFADYMTGGKKRATHRTNFSYLNIYGGTAAPAVNERKLELTRMIALNYAKLALAGLKTRSAYICAALRARWAFTGALKVAIDDTSTVYDEIDKVDGTDPIYGRIVNAATMNDIYCSLGTYATDFAKYQCDKSFGISWVLRHAENIWAAAEHCFRVRNHHFKDDKQHKKSYEDLYKTFLGAAFEGKMEWPKDVEFIDVFRTAIHPFKLRALPVMAAHYTAYGKLASAAITRTSGSPCGLAAITTTVAALDTMNSESWYPAFSKAYQEPIAAAREFAKAINNDKYSFHMSAALYGLPKIKKLTIGTDELTLDEAKSYISVVASACQGLISALNGALKNNYITSFALSNAKALEKSAKQNPMMAMRVTSLVEFSVSEISDAKSMKDAIRIAIPETDEKNRQLAAAATPAGLSQGTS